jgi:cell division protein ZapA
MAHVDLLIAGRTYQIACRDGEEENLRTAARMVDAKSREALSGLGTLSESRQLLFASLLLADQMIEAQRGGGAASVAMPEPAEPDPVIAERVAKLAERLESLAHSLENEAEEA